MKLSLVGTSSRPLHPYILLAWSQKFRLRTLITFLWSSNNNRPLSLPSTEMVSQPIFPRVIILIFWMNDFLHRSQRSSEKWKLYPGGRIWRGIQTNNRRLQRSACQRILMNIVWIKSVRQDDVLPFSQRSKIRDRQTTFASRECHPNRSPLTSSLF